MCYWIDSLKGTKPHNEGLEGPRLCTTTKRETNKGKMGGWEKKKPSTLYGLLPCTGHTGNAQGGQRVGHTYTEQCARAKTEANEREGMRDGLNAFLAQDRSSNLNWVDENCLP